MVQHDSQTVDIAAGIGSRGSTFRHLWSHVGRCAQQRSGPRELRVLFEGGQTKIQQQRLATGPHHGQIRSRILPPGFFERFDSFGQNRPNTAIRFAAGDVFDDALHGAARAADSFGDLRSREVVGYELQNPRVAFTEPFKNVGQQGVARFSD